MRKPAFPNPSGRKGKWNRIAGSARDGDLAKVQNYFDTGWYNAKSVPVNRAGAEIVF